jgi:cysteine-rich repeat protein
MKYLSVLLLLVPFAACSASSADGEGCTNASDARKIKIGNSVYCTCADPKDTGTKVCGADGQWGACSPCIPTEPDDSGPYDAGPPSDAPYGCGDGVNDDGEACDDGNLKDGDLCSSKCLPLGTPAAASLCPGQEVHVWSNALEFSTSTATDGSSNDSAATRCATVDGGEVRTGSSSPEHVFAVVAHRSGSLTVTTRNATFDHLLYVRSECAIKTTETACVNRSTSFAGETLSLPVKQGDTRYVILDGAFNSSGSTQIKFEIREARAACAC